MKITKIFSIGEYENVEGLEIKINGERAFSIFEGEPEDMTIGRNLSGVYSIVGMMKKAYEAGKAGEAFEVETINESEDEE